MSKNLLAEKLGVSTATLSNIENEEHWERVSDEMVLRLWNVLKTTDWEVVETHNFKSVFTTCNHAKDRKRMLGIVGATGYGKTTALKEYYHSHKNTYLITCGKSMTAKQLVQQVLREMGISFNGTVYHIIERITQELNKQQHPLLIIDEAGNLSQLVIEYIHDLRNATEHNCGIVLSGVAYFKDNLKTAADNNKEGMPEFYDRISSWVTLESPTRHEIRAVCKINGLEETDIVKKLFKAGNFRKLINYVENYFLNAGDLSPLGNDMSIRL